LIPDKGFHAKKYELLLLLLLLLVLLLLLLPSKQPEQIYNLHENDKKRLYSSRILEVERGTFIPLVFTATGNNSPSTTYVVYATACVYRELHGKTTDHKKGKCTFWKNVHFSPVKGRVISARSNSNGPIRVESETTLRAAVVASLYTSV